MTTPVANGRGVTQRGDADVASLVRACARGEADALSALYDATGDVVYRLSLMVLGDAESASASTYRTFSAVWEQSARYDRVRQGNALSWLVTIAYQQARGRPA